MAAEPAQQVDVAIVGGGMVGASLALALASSALKIMLIEGVAPGAVGQPSFDDRATALGNGTRSMLQALQVWPAIAPQAAAIEAIHVSDAGHPGVARLRAAEQGIDAFGYVVTNRVLGQVLWQALQRCENVARCMPARATWRGVAADWALLEVTAANQSTKVQARLVVAADGADSAVRAAVGLGADTVDYAQVAIIANVGTAQPHQGQAYERFTAFGPIALLPLQDGNRGLIWTLPAAAASRVLGLADREFLRELQRAFGWRAGRFSRVGRRGQYPLALTRASETLAPRCVLIGNAAQALHPVAGQGFNLGMRDAAMLAELLVTAPDDCGAAPLLAGFDAARTADRSGITRFTDRLVRGFGDRRPGMAMLRSLGLLAFDLSPTAKSALSRLSWGFGEHMPRLSRGLPLSVP